MPFGGHASGFGVYRLDAHGARGHSSRFRRRLAGLTLALAFALIGWIIAGRPAAAAYEGAMPAFDQPAQGV